MTDEISAPDPIDLYVGERFRTLRTAAGVSQRDIAEGLGVTFQQVQKYERAKNRISASMLAKMANFLGVGILDFYPPEGGGEGELPFASLKGAKQLATSYRALSDKQRQLVVDLARELARSEPR